MSTFSLSEIRNQLPSVQNKVFFNTGTCGPLPLNVVNRMKETLEKQLIEGRITIAHFEEMMKTKDENKSLIAELINCKEEEISITGSTSDGLNIVINGFDWKHDDELITTNAEHPTAWSPAYNLSSKGVKVKLLDALEGFDSVLEQLDNLITENTRLLSISQVIYCSGDHLPVKEMINLAHSRNVPVLIDGAQVFGAMQLDVKDLGCDYFSAPGQKWICGPESTGFLYVSEHALFQPQPTFTGYFSIKDLDLEKGLTLQENGQRYEFGTVQPANIAGMNEALKWFKSIGPEKIYERNQSLAAKLYEALAGQDHIDLINHACQSTLLSFNVKGKSPEEVAAKLFEKGIVVRTVPITNSVRVSTGFYNTEEEVDILLKALNFT